MPNTALIGFSVAASMSCNLFLTLPPNEGLKMPTTSPRFVICSGKSLAGFGENLMRGLSSGGIFAGVFGGN